jgi:signal transduction histidine kinase
VRIRPKLDSTWLALLFLIVGVIAPTTCVLWFMRDAARAQADAARQSVAEAYRGQLKLLRDQTDAYWEGRAVALQRSAGKGDAADFARSVRAGLADSFILANYPAPSVASTPDPAATAARDAQARIRSLTGEKEAALKAIDEYFTRGRLAKATDLEGRLIAADEQLLALHLLPPRDARRAVVIHRLVAMLNDYDTTKMPAAQRLFLMDEVRASYRTYDAERLAAQLLEADSSRTIAPGLQSTKVPGLWKLSDPSGRSVAIYRTATVLDAMRGILDDGGKGVKFAAVPPGAPSGEDAIAAGTMLPGWQLSISIVDPRLIENAARSRMASYLWAGYLVIGAMAITGLLAGQSFRRQMRLARLKTDLVAAVSHELKTPLSSMRLLVDSLLADQEFEANKTREYLQLVAGENLRLTRLVENFLTFSRIERNRQRFEFERSEPADIVASAAGVMRERFNDLTVDVAPGLPAIHADPDALLMALVNLLDNAWKYTRSEKRICLRATREAGQVVFAVEDNGIGIAAREQKRIFRRFYQVDARLARETGGCGLGLTIVESIARAHGGSVRVASEVNAGSTFSLCLPV